MQVSEVCVVDLETSMFMHSMFMAHSVIVFVGRSLVSPQPQRTLR